MALTGMPVRGADLVYCGLAKHWMSPEALPFMELTAEKQLEVSEADARALLDEHSLPLIGLGNKTLPWTLEKFIPLIKEAFAKESITEIKEALRKGRDNSAAEKKFAADCLDGINRASPLALSATLTLIRKGRKARNEAPWEMRRGISGMSAMDGALEACLRNEFRVQTRLLEHADAILGCRAHCLGEAVNPDNWRPPPIPSDLNDLEKPPMSGEDFAVYPRAEMAFSRHPRLRGTMTNMMRPQQLIMIESS